MFYSFKYIDKSLKMHKNQCVLIDKYNSKKEIFDEKIFHFSRYYL